jgi:uncharacterized protein (TIGR03435 family)
MTKIAFTLLGVLGGTAIRAQSPSPQSARVLPKFEVVSIRPCQASDVPSKEGRGGRPAAVDPGMLRLECRTTDDLIRLAYIRFASGKVDGVLTAMDTVLQRLMRQPIDGSPSWIKSDRYTISAESETPQSAAMMQGPVLQALLEDRFKLRVRRDVREVPVYAIVVGNGGPKLVTSKKESCTAFDLASPAPTPPTPGQPPLCGFFRPDRNGGVETLGQTLAGLCMQFSAALDRAVVDRTGIAGAFDIHLDLTPDDLFPFARHDDAAAAADAAPPDPLGAITRAVQRLGLKLEATRVSTEFIAIEHVERPSEN